MSKTTITKGKMLVQYIPKEEYYNRSSKFSMRDLKDITYEVGVVVAMGVSGDTSLIRQTVFFTPSYILHIKDHEGKISQLHLISEMDALLFIDEN